MSKGFTSNESDLINAVARAISQAEFDDGQPFEVLKYHERQARAAIANVREGKE